MNRFFRRFGYFMIFIGLWTNGFMLGAVERIIKETSRCEFNTYFIITFLIILEGIIYIKIDKMKNEK